MRTKVLIIEDEIRMQHLLNLVLSEEGYEVVSGGNGIEGISLWQETEPDVVITDLKMPHADGLEVLDFRNRQFKNTPLIVLTAHGTIQSAVTAMKQGAYDYLTKPMDNTELVNVVAKAVADASSGERIALMSRGTDRMIGSSGVMNKLRQDIKMISSTSMTVLVTGESGTGKELIAQAIHRNSGRDSASFVRVNCAAIPRDLLESELFGHTKGAFTGAVENRQGAFMQADKGTLFLDEIGDLPLELQPKILHAVEEKMVTPVGSAIARKVDVKIIAATNRNLEKMVRDNLFRSDLYHRLNMYPLSLPPLRKRDNDLEELVAYFVEQFCFEHQKEPLSFGEGVLELLKNYHWPGNIRELRNVLERIVVVATQATITKQMLPEKIRDEVLVLKKKRDNCLDLSGQEKRLITEALEQSGWNQSRAARKLGITRNTLRYRMKKYTIKPV